MVAMSISGIPTPVPVSNYTCYNLCANSCTANPSSPFCTHIDPAVDEGCEGYLGADDASSRALCITEETAQYFCDKIDNCGGYARHATLNRFILYKVDENGVVCHADDRKNYVTYDVYIAGAAAHDDAPVANCLLQDYSAAITEVEVSVIKGSTGAPTVSPFSCSNAVTTTSSTVDGSSITITFSPPVHLTTVDITFGAPSGAAERTTVIKFKGPRVSYSHTVESATASVAVPHTKVDQPLLARSYFDLGLSWSQVARFRNLHFPNAGTYKACFCDSRRLQPAQPALASSPLAPTFSACTAKEDFVIEVGKVHVSGVSCLLGDTRFRAVDCHTNFFGGLTCYKEAISLDIPTVSDEIVLQTYNSLPTEAATQLTTFCLFNPSEITGSLLDICQRSTMYQDESYP